MQKIILQTKNLSKNFGKRTAVQNLNLNIYKGDIFGFLGPNGAGKSTTIRMIIGLISPSDGEVIINNKKYHHRNKNIRQKIRVLIEEPKFYEYMSALENMKILAQLSGIKNTSNIENCLKLVNLYSRRYDKVHSFSQGMKQRLGIAQTLLGNPELIILDEPTNGLDPQGIREIRELILNLNKRKNITFIISSHILQEIENCCNRLAILKEGNLLVQGDIHKLLKGKSLEEYFISLTDTLTKKENKNIL